LATMLMNRSISRDDSPPGSELPVLMPAKAGR
jgi:hypothetical protein